jgi:hypothetical protein
MLATAQHSYGKQLMKLTPSFSLLAAAMIPLLAGATAAQPLSATTNRPISGATSPETVNREVSLQWLRDAGATWAGSEAGAGIGRTVSAAGDVNGDGIDDMLVSAYQDGDSAAPGTVYVVFGADHSLPNLTTLNSPAPSAASPQRGNGFGPLSAIAKQAVGYAILQGAENGDRTGAALAAAGDVNGDGIGDILVGAPHFDGAAGPNSGAVYLIYGQSNWDQTLALGALTPGQATVFEGRNANDRLGAALAGVSDMNGDGTDDIAMGAFNASPSSVTSGFSLKPNQAGQTFVVFGKSSLGNSFSLKGLGSAGLVINGASAGDQSGRAISAAGDMNNDGLADMILGAQQHNAPGVPGSGAAYVVFGNLALGGRLSLNTLANDGMTILGVEEGAHLGWSVAGGADMNGDGFDDVAIGAPDFSASPFGSSNEGRLYTINGSLTLPSSVNLNRLNDANVLDGDTSNGGFVPAGSNPGRSTKTASGTAMNKPLGGSVITGADIGGRSGSVLAMGGDMNGDNLGDLLIGSASTSNTYLLHGTVAAPANLDLANLSYRGLVLEGLHVGESLAFVGDLNGDKFDDLVVGNKSGLHQRMYNAGTATVIKGASHILQAAGQLSAGSVFEMIVHGTPNQPWLLMVAPAALDEAIFTGRGAWWLDSYSEVLDKTHGSNGETLITVAIPDLPMVNGATVYWQAIEASTGRHLDLTQLLVTTVD